MHESILERIEKEYDTISRKIKNHQKGVTSDDLSKAMHKILPAIEILIYTSSASNSLYLPYGALFGLKTSSYDNMDNMERTCGEGNRPSDKPADSLLAGIIEKRLAEGHRWDWDSDLEELSQEAKDLMDYGIEPWYPKTRQLLRLQTKTAKRRSEVSAGKTLPLKQMADGTK